MAQRFKLRLSDGTFLSVDVEGLRAWTHDGAALVQVVGNQQWRPLKQVLAEEENAERLLKALIPPKPKGATPAPEPEPPAAAPPPAAAAPTQAFEPAPLDLPPLDPPSFGTGTPSFGQPLAFGEPAFGDPPPVSDSPAFSEPSYREPAGAPRAATASQVLAEETSASSPDINDASLPAIRLKPLDQKREWVALMLKRPQRGSANAFEKSVEIREARKIGADHDRIDEIADQPRQVSGVSS